MALSVHSLHSIRLSAHEGVPAGAPGPPRRGVGGWGNPLIRLETGFRRGGNPLIPTPLFLEMEPKTASNRAQNTATQIK